MESNSGSDGISKEFGIRDSRGSDITGIFITLFLCPQLVDSPSKSDASSSTSGSEAGDEPNTQFINGNNNNENEEDEVEDEDEEEEEEEIVSMPLNVAFLVDKE